MPFVGGGIGYSLAPVQVVEVPKIVVRESLPRGVTDLSKLGVVIKDVNEYGTGFHIEVTPCYGCDPESIYDKDSYVFNTENGQHEQLGKIVAFSWVNGGFRYKSLPEDDALFDCPLNADGNEIWQLCKPKIDDLPWKEVAFSFE